MCLAPGILPNGQEIACRQCWQCRERKINDWAGRCIAESKTSVATHFITLTYGRDEFDNIDHMRARVLTYSDVQKYLKYLRADGFPLRYLVAGEYGAKNGRCHWHLLMFWQRAVPEHKIGLRFNQKHWPHGFSEWDPINVNSARYVCKYIQKDSKAGDVQYHLAMSKKPPLGAHYFRGLATDYVKQGLSPQTLEYSFDDARKLGGEKRKFQMFGATADLFFEAYLKAWSLRYPRKQPPFSQVLTDWEDAKNREAAEDARFEHYQAKRMRALGRPTGSDIKWFMKFDNIRYSAGVHQWYYLFDDATRWWWGVANDGKPEWQEDAAIRGNPKAAPSALPQI